MKIDLNKLQILKERIKTAKEVNEPVHYFFDNFADHEEFIAMGVQTEDKILDAILLGIGQEVFKKKNVKIQQKIYFGLKEHNFIHGPVIIENCMMSFAYFTDIRLGVFSVHLPTQVMYGRMNALSLKNFKMPPDVTLN